MGNLKILQIVGYKNSGKTTLIKNWIEQCLKDNKEVAVIKHHGHKAGLAMPTSTTDSMGFFEAGAKSAIVSDGTTIQLHQQNVNWTLEHYIELAHLSNPSVLFIEGFKEADYPKVVLVKSEAEWQTLKSLSNIILVIWHDITNVKNETSLSANQTSAINNWFRHWIRGDEYKTV